MIQIRLVWLTNMSDDTLHPLEHLLDRHLVFSEPHQHLREWVTSVVSTPPTPSSRLLSSAWPHLLGLFLSILLLLYLRSLPCFDCLLLPGLNKSVFICLWTAENGGNQLNWNDLFFCYYILELLKGWNGLFSCKLIKQLFLFLLNIRITKRLKWFKITTEMIYNLIKRIFFVFRKKTVEQLNFYWMH